MALWRRSALPPTVQRFQDQVADLRATVARLERVKREMTDVVGAMKTENDGRERIFVAQMMLAEVRGILQSASVCREPSSTYNDREHVA